VGRIAMANSDAGWSAYAHSAIDEAARAVEELASSGRQVGGATALVRES
jgi:spermidine dehydrogenase